MNEPPPSPADVDPSLPADLVRVVEKALQKDRAARFVSCAEMEEALKKVLEALSGPVAGPPVRAGADVDVAPGPRTFGSARLDERALVAPAGPATEADLPLRPEPPAGETPPPLATAPAETGGALRVFLGALAVLLVVGGGLAWLLLGPGAKKSSLLGGGAEPTPAATAEPSPAPEPTATTPPPTPTPAPTVATTGTAVVSSNVYAQLAIDGTSRGGVLKATTFRLAPGRHVASFESGGFGPIRVPFEVKPGESATVRADFPPLGQLWISVNPDAVGAEILVDGVLAGRAGNAPLRKTVAAGDRRVSARLAGFETAERTVEVFEQDKADVLLELRRK
jgi:hypothetical protein